MIRFCFCFLFVCCCCWGFFVCLFVSFCFLLCFVLFCCFCWDLLLLLLFAVVAFALLICCFCCCLSRLAVLFSFCVCVLCFYLFYFVLSWGGGRLFAFCFISYLFQFVYSVVTGVRPPCWPSGKASASRAEDPGFESRLRRDFFGVGSYQ